MRSGRPTVVLIAVLAVFVAWMRVAEPAWVRNAGLDVWNATRMESDRRAADRDSARLDAGRAAAATRMAANDHLAWDAAAGRITLVRAVAAATAQNRDNPAFELSLRERFAAPTPGARVALWLMERAERIGADPRDVAALRAEYAVAFEGRTDDAADRRVAAVLPPDRDPDLAHRRLRRLGWLAGERVTAAGYTVTLTRAGRTVSATATSREQAWRAAERAAGRADGGGPGR